MQEQLYDLRADRFGASARDFCARKKQLSVQSGTVAPRKKISKACRAEAEQLFGVPFRKVRLVWLTPSSGQPARAGSVQ